MLDCPMPWYGVPFRVLWSIPSTMNNQLSTWFNLQSLLLDPLGVQVKCFNVLPFQLWTLTG